MGKVPYFFSGRLKATALFRPWRSHFAFNGWEAFRLNKRFPSMERRAAAPSNGQVSWNPQVRATWPWPGDHRSIFTGLGIRVVCNALRAWFVIEKKTS